MVKLLLYYLLPKLEIYSTQLLVKIKFMGVGFESHRYQKLAEREGFLLPRRSTSPPKPAALTVIRSAHSPSTGGIRVGFESHVLFSLFLFSRYTTYEIRYTIHGGEGGIRTLGKALDPPHDFQSCTFDRSVTSPIADVLLYQKLAKEQSKLRSSGMFSVKCFAKN